MVRLNRFLALTTSLSRRDADSAIADGHVIVNGKPAKLGQIISDTDIVSYKGISLHVSKTETITIMLHKPTGYICSRDGQGGKTIYDLLPNDLHNLNPIGRLDKDSSGLLLLTNDGKLAHRLSHPSFEKSKVYEVTSNKPISKSDLSKLKSGVMLGDGISSFDSIINISSNTYKVTIHEGRNRQIRRTFESMGYEVLSLHRTQFGPYELASLKSGSFDKIIDAL